MGLLQNLVKGLKGDKREFKEKFKAAQEEEKIMTLIEERKKSANKRELERYYKENEEARIKMALDKIHKKQNQEMWKTKKTILGEPTTMLKDDRPILKEKNLFLNQNKIPFVKGGNNMFFNN